MKNILILIITLFATYSYCQDVKWIPSGETTGACTMETDCRTSTMCYSLEYTPKATGVLTSYTTGFLANCLGDASNVLYNQSCAIVDNSRVLDACSSYGKMLLNCSGNTGNINVVLDQPVILHQVCFEMDNNEEVNLEVDPTTGVTISIDVSESQFETSYPEYQAYRVSTRAVDSPCDELEEEGTFTFDNNDGLAVYPNPSTGTVKIFFEDGGQDAQVTITSALNQSLVSRAIKCGKEHNMDLSHLNPGTYIALVKGEKSTHSSKFIIVK